MALKKDLAWLHDLAQKKSGTCLATYYVNNNTKVPWKCNDENHNIWLSTPANISRGRWCPECWRDRYTKYKNIKSMKFFKICIIRELISEEKISMGLSIQRYCVCKCDCGKENLIIRLSSLLQEDTKSCGCWQKERHITSIESKIALLNKIIQDYVRSAKKRNISFELSSKDVKDIITENCFYCGVKPLINQYSRFFGKDFDHHGIDRLNSNIGYIKSNCVTACTWCNESKNNLNLSDFLSVADRINTRNEMIKDSRYVSDISETVRFWICKKCGELLSVNEELLSCPKKSPCCNKYGYFPEELSRLNEILRRYKERCKNKKHGRIKFNLEPSEVLNLITRSCFYCDRMPCNTLSSKKTIFNSFETLGIDRLDSSLSYDSINCVPCCRTCNIFKWDRTIIEMLEHAERIVKFQDFRWNNIYEELK